MPTWVICVGCFQSYRKDEHCCRCNCDCGEGQAKANRYRDVLVRIGGHCYGWLNECGNSVEAYGREQAAQEIVEELAKVGIDSSDFDETECRRCNRVFLSTYLQTVMSNVGPIQLCAGCYGVNDVE